MRRRLVLGVGLAGVLTTSAAVAQFAADRVPAGAPQGPATVPFASGQPSGTLPRSAPAPIPNRGGYVPPVGALTPASAMTPAGAGAVRPANRFQPATGFTPTAPANDAIPTALGPNHPWVVRPEMGPYFICVKSYSRPARPEPTDPGLPAKDLAEGLAAEIRETYQVGAYLYEYISEEKKAQMAARAAALRQRDQFRVALDEYYQKSRLQGMEFIEPDNKIYYKTFRYRDQIGVLVGPFQSEADAVKALAKVKTWPSPKDKRLMDVGVIATRGKSGQSRSEGGYLNPYPQAMVVPNPTIPHTAAPTPAGLDPFVIKLNEDRQYSLLKATRGWTLAVKSFSAPVVIQTKDDEGSSLMRKHALGKGADVLEAGAEQAEQLAKALRDPRMKPHPFEAFVLHTRTASLVTVGQFDSPTDPALLETRRILMGLTFNISRDDRGAAMTGTAQRLFGDHILPIPIPKQ